MKKFHPAYYFDTVILIFCIFVPHLLYHFTFLGIISNNYLFFSPKLISKKLQNYVITNSLEEKVTLIQSCAVMEKLNAARRKCHASRAKIYNY